MTIFRAVIEPLVFVTQTNVYVMAVFNKICGNSLMLKNSSLSICSSYAFIQYSQQPIYLLGILHHDRNYIEA